MATSNQATNANTTDWGALAGQALGAYMGGQGGSPMAVADPFGSQRGQYQGQLQQFMSGGANPHPNLGLMQSMALGIPYNPATGQQWAGQPAAGGQQPIMGNPQGNPQMPNYAPYRPMGTGAAYGSSTSGSSAYGGGGGSTGTTSNSNGGPGGVGATGRGFSPTQMGMVSVLGQALGKMGLPGALAAAILTPFTKDYMHQYNLQALMGDATTANSPGGISYGNGNVGYTEGAAAAAAAAAEAGGSSDGGGASASGDSGTGPGGYGGYGGNGSAASTSSTSSTSSGDGE